MLRKVILLLPLILLAGCAVQSYTAPEEISDSCANNGVCGKLNPLLEMNLEDDEKFVTNADHGVEIASVDFSDFPAPEEAESDASDEGVSATRTVIEPSDEGYYSGMRWQIRIDENGNPAWTKPGVDPVPFSLPPEILEKICGGECKDNNVYEIDEIPQGETPQ